MTNKEAKKMLKAKLECLKRETSGTDIDCNHRNCDECNLCYEQGSMGEQKEALDMAIKALEQTELTPSYNGVKSELDCVSREAVQDLIAKLLSDYLHDEDREKIENVNAEIGELPSVQPQPITLEKAIDYLHEIGWMQEHDKEMAQPRWIPCSEKLPDTDDKVLCWYEYYHWSREKVLPEYGIGCYLRETSAWFGEVANGKDVRVIAWMPLPKGYEPEQAQPHMMCEED